MVKRTYDSQVDVAFGTDEVGDRYAVISQGQGTRMTLRENEIMLKSAFVTADTDPSKWIQMADGSLLYPVDVSFEEPFFATKPNAIVAVTGFQYSPHAVNQAILVEAKNTLPDGFKIHFSSRPGASITQIHAHWLAYGSRQD